MKKLNRLATRLFLKLIGKLNGQDYVKCESEGFMPLSVEKLETVDTPVGKGVKYSVAHHYMQNGDVMRDPEMCFVVVDLRKDPTDYDLVAIYPQLFQQDNLSVFEESMDIEDGVVKNVKPIWQADHCAFAFIWLTNIQQQGFLR